MSGSHRRHRWFSSWWSRGRPSDWYAGGNVPSSSLAAPTTFSPPWSTDITRELPALRHVPLMTRAQLFRGNGGRWPR